MGRKKFFEIFLVKNKKTYALSCANNETVENLQKRKKKKEKSFFFFTSHQFSLVKTVSKHCHQLNLTSLLSLL